VLLVRRDLDVVWPDSWLNGGGVIKTLDIVEIGNIESRNVVCGGQSEVCESAVLGDVGAGGLSDLFDYSNDWNNLLDGDSVTGCGTKIVQELSNTLFAV